MTSFADRIRHVSLKIAHAKVHTAELREAFKRFFDAKPYKVSAKYDPATHRLIYYISEAQTAPEELSLLSGDTLQNLATALDHLPYLRAITIGGSIPASYMPEAVG